MENSEDNVPARIRQIAGEVLPAGVLTPAMWRRVDAEVSSNFRPELTDPCYDEWLGLQLRRLDPTEQTSFRLLLDIRQLAKRIESRPDFNDRQDLKWLAADITERHRTWQTDWLLARISRPNAGFARQILEAVDRASRDPALSAAAPMEEFNAATPTELDRLPSQLWDFAKKACPERTNLDSFWNAVREHVYPHFISGALDVEPYREYLALAIRHYALGETQQIQSRVRRLAQATTDAELISPYDARRTGLDNGLLADKCRDLLEDIDKASAANRRRPKPGRS